MKLLFPAFVLSYSSIPTKGSILAMFPCENGLNCWYFICTLWYRYYNYDDHFIESMNLELLTSTKMSASLSILESLSPYNCIEESDVYKTSKLLRTLKPYPFRVDTSPEDLGFNLLE